MVSGSVVALQRRRELLAFCNLVFPILPFGLHVKTSFGSSSHEQSYDRKNVPSDRAEPVDGPTLFSTSGSVRTNIALIASQYANTKLNVVTEVLDLPSSTFISYKVTFILCLVWIINQMKIYI